MKYKITLYKNLSYFDLHKSYIELHLYNDYFVHLPYAINFLEKSRNFLPIKYFEYKTFISPFIFHLFYDVDDDLILNKINNYFENLIFQ